MQSLLDTLTRADIVALCVFIFTWLLFEFITDFSTLRRRSLSGLMEVERRGWMIALASRDMRMVDTQIINGLQQGSAFFASTSIFAIGGAFAMLGSTDMVIEIYRDLPLTDDVSRALWELKVLGLICLFTYTFFKFGWAYRLFNYCSIMIGGVPERSEQTEKDVIGQAAHRAAEMNVLGGRHFNSGLRGFFYSMGYMGWFIGPTTMIVSTVFIMLVLTRRQYFSKAVKTLREPGTGS